MSQTIVNLTDILKMSSTCAELNVADFSTLFWIEVSRFTRDHIIPTFLNHFELEKQHLEILKNELYTKNNIKFCKLQYHLFEQFTEALDELEYNYRTAKTMWEKIHVYKNDKDLKEHDFDCQFYEILLASLPTSFQYFVYAFYFVSFNVFSKWCSKTNCDLPTSIIESDHCTGCNLQNDSCRCEYYSSIIKARNASVLNMKLLERFAGQTMTLLVKKRIKDYIYNTCHGTYDRSHISHLEEWLDRIVISWMTFVIKNGNLEDWPDNTKPDADVKVKLTYFLYETFAHSVIDQFFNIVIDFPESIPAIEDLKMCAEKIEMKEHLIKSLKNLFQSRILHPGVNTIDILTGYVAAIKAIQQLDSSGIILETVTEPIKEYLRNRSDTVRRVVTALTEDGPTDLSEELAKGKEIKKFKKSSVKDNWNNWETWIPNSSCIDCYLNTVRDTHTNECTDIISMLVDIYGSKEVFMNEYRNLMADRLLTKLDFTPDKELRNLELLKIRFGETLLHNCEVMLKDVSDSKRINMHIKSDKKYQDKKSFEISSLIISDQFWPLFNKESLELPEEFASEFKKYTESYEAYKGNRTLNWRSVTGRVDIEIELQDRTIHMAVQPTQAVIIYHFQQKKEWNIEELSNLMKVPPSPLRRRLGFWQAHGLIFEEEWGVYKLVEEKSQKPQLLFFADDEVVESAMVSESDQREEELQVFWSYIIGMLTNLDSLPIERIYQMLKMFATNGLGVEISIEKLKEFLQRKVREQKLVYCGGVYQLPK